MFKRILAICIMSLLVIMPISTFANTASLVKTYLTVENPGFESGNTGTTVNGITNLTIPGWEQQMILSSSTSVNLYTEIGVNSARQTTDADKGQVLKLYDQVSNMGMVVATNYIEVPEINLTQKIDYTTTLDYYIQSKMTISMAFFNSSKQIWSGTDWQSNNNLLNTHFQQKDANGNLNFTHYMPDNNNAVTYNWSVANHERTAPIGTKYLRIYVVGVYNLGGYDVMVDNFKLYGMLPQAEVSNLKAVTGGEKAFISFVEPTMITNYSGTKIYKDNTLVATLPKGTNNYEFSGLNTGQQFSLKVTTLYNDGSESEGLTRNVIVASEKPIDTSNVRYLEVLNPGFERTATGTNVEISDWVTQMILNSELSSDLYTEIGVNSERKAADGDKGQVLKVYDQKSTAGLVVGSTYIEVPEKNLTETVAYTLNMDYYMGSKMTISMAFFNSDKQIWDGTTWVNSSDTNLNWQFQQKDANGTENRSHYMSSEGTGVAKEWSVVNHERTAPIGTKYLRVYIVGVYNLGGYDVLVDNIKVSYPIEKVQLDISKLGNGSISTSGTLSVEKGTTQEITVTPNEGYEIEYIKLNGVPVVSYQKSEFTYETPKLTKNSIVTISFKEIITVPEIAIIPTAYIDTETERAGYTFATAREKFGSQSRVEFGMLLSKEVIALENFVLNGAGVIKVDATVAPNILGQYGIRFLINSPAIGKTYYTRAYAIYSVGETQTIVYGDSIISFEI